MFFRSKPIWFNIWFKNAEDQAKYWLSWLAYIMGFNNLDVFQIEDLLLIWRDNWRAFPRYVKFAHGLFFELFKNLISGLILFLGTSFVLGFGWRFGLILGFVFWPTYYIIREFAYLVIFGVTNIWAKSWGGIIMIRRENGWDLEGSSEGYESNKKTKMINYFQRLIFLIIQLITGFIFIVGLVYWDARSYSSDALLIAIFIILGVTLSDKIKKYRLADLQRRIRSIKNRLAQIRNWSKKNNSFLRDVHEDDNHEHNYYDDHIFSSLNLFTEDPTLKWDWGRALKGGLILGLFFGLVLGPCFLLMFWLNGEPVVLIGSILVDFGLTLMPVGAVMGVAIYGLTFKVEEVVEDTQSIRVWTRNAVFGGSIFLLNFGLIFILTLGLKDGLIGGLFAGLVGIFWFGGYKLLNYYSLRLTFVVLGITPLNYTRFLDYAVDRHLLQKVGGGYRFIHRMMREHFEKMY